MPDCPNPRPGDGVFHLAGSAIRCRIDRRKAPIDDGADPHLIRDGRVSAVTFDYRVLPNPES
ncbi:hypothetical protein NITHO_6460003 [Nitrolancea hollandica Lb]|uniref:Uncharacterized protein n=1 Tax=Nitrolancea hollandica Lb TaxID=1129897 RepID=I4EMS0_9BACT|nr:hypothetical protein NITHO_6460003 [Nitrolancea hollandica Lb]